MTMDTNEARRLGWRIGLGLVVGVYLFLAVLLLVAI